jgi:hypothetical protein
MQFGLSSLFCESRKGEGWEIGSIIRKTPAAYAILKWVFPHLVEKKNNIFSKKEH